MFFLFDYLFGFCMKGEEREINLDGLEHGKKISSAKNPDDSSKDKENDVDNGSDSSLQEVGNGGVENAEVEKKKESIFDGDSLEKKEEKESRFDGDSLEKKEEKESIFDGDSLEKKEEKELEEEVKIPDDSSSKDKENDVDNGSDSLLQEVGNGSLENAEFEKKKESIFDGDSLEKKEEKESIFDGDSLEKKEEKELEEEVKIPDDSSSKDKENDVGNGSDSLLQEIKKSGDVFNENQGDVKKEEKTDTKEPKSPTKAKRSATISGATVLNPKVDTQVSSQNMEKRAASKDRINPGKSHNMKASFFGNKNPKRSSQSKARDANKEVAEKLKSYVQIKILMAPIDNIEYWIPSFRYSKEEILKAVANGRDVKYVALVCKGVFWGWTMKWAESKNPEETKEINVKKDSKFYDNFLRLLQVVKIKDSYEIVSSKNMLDMNPKNNVQNNVFALTEKVYEKLSAEIEPYMKEIKGKVSFDAKDSDFINNFYKMREYKKGGFCKEPKLGAFGESPTTKRVVI